MSLIVVNVVSFFLSCFADLKWFEFEGLFNCTFCWTDLVC